MLVIIRSGGLAPDATVRVAYSAIFNTYIGIFPPTEYYMHIVSRDAIKMMLMTVTHSGAQHVLMSSFTMSTLGYPG